MKNKLIGLLSSLVLGVSIATTANATLISAGGGSFIQSWGRSAGHPDTQTYGQTITTPSDNVLDSFSFWLAPTSRRFPIRRTPASHSWPTYITGITLCPWRSARHSTPAVSSSITRRQLLLSLSTRSIRAAARPHHRRHVRIVPKYVPDLRETDISNGRRRPPTSTRAAISSS